MSRIARCLYLWVVFSCVWSTCGRLRATTAKDDNHDMNIPGFWRLVLALASSSLSGYIWSRKTEETCRVILSFTRNKSQSKLCSHVLAHIQTHTYKIIMTATNNSELLLKEVNAFLLTCQPYRPLQKHKEFLSPYTCYGFCRVCSLKWVLQLSWKERGVSMWAKDNNVMAGIR